RQEWTMNRQDSDHNAGNQFIDDEASDQEASDKDTLMNLVHEKRGLPAGTEPPRRPTRITHHEIKAMKVTVQKEDSPFVTIFRKIGGLIGGVIGGFFGIFTSFIPSGRGKKSTACQLNGHVFPRNWKGDFPRCTHCRKEITSPDSAKPDK
ncbi:MAG: hypothetical protein K8F91_05665, partial [Candidatus Obscuribacterales bacterium]|nr:hypothetical protein [Candidatus Obscuribacterales bacterium]